MKSLNNLSVLYCVFIVFQDSLVGSNHGKETARYRPSAEIREGDDDNTWPGFNDFAAWSSCNWNFQYKLISFKSIKNLLLQIEKIWLRNGEKSFICGNVISVADIMACCELEQPLMAGFDVRKNRSKPLVPNNSTKCDISTWSNINSFWF